MLHQFKEDGQIPRDLILLLIKNEPVTSVDYNNKSWDIFTWKMLPPLLNPGVSILFWLRSYYSNTQAKVTYLCENVKMLNIYLLI